MRIPSSRAGLPLIGLLAVGLFAGGCSSVSEVTKERVARSESSLQQAQQAVGRSEAGAVELQRAKDNLEQAKAVPQTGKAKQIFATLFDRLSQQAAAK